MSAAVLEVTRRACVDVTGLGVRFLAFSQDDPNQVIRTLRQIAAPHRGADLVIRLGNEETDIARRGRITVRLKRINFGQLTNISVHAVTTACWRGRAYKTSAPATIHWSFDESRTTQATEATDTGIGCWFTDLPAAELKPGAEIVFTFRWVDKQEEKQFRVIIAES